MKKFLKPIVLSTITLFAISCSSSDDNTPKPEESNTLTVLKEVTITDYSNIVNSKLKPKSELSEQSTITYEYNESGKVSSFSYKGKQEIQEGGQDFNLNYVYTYNNDGTLKELIGTSYPENDIEEHFIYEYNDKKQIVKNTDKESDETLSYTYDNNNRIIYVTSDRKDSPYKLEYTYDTKNNIVKGNYVSETFKKTNEYTFDNKLSPFTNMSINNMHMENLLPENLPETFLGVNNVITSTDKDFQALNTTSVYEYNTSNFPIKVTTHHTLNPKNIHSVITYTYKTIKVKK
ncbi:hypothetical protein [Myroides odoratimimus]|nr:hypothetical protein [Myroides odoratimimus]